MHSVNNRRNHDFQILHFLVGKCHTADGAYALLCDLREDRALALGVAKAGAKRNEAAQRRAKQRAESVDELEALEGEADLLELEAHTPVTAACVAAGEAELAFIERCLEKLEPHRKHRDRPAAEAHEAAQREEWALELVHRAENFLITTGSIPPDELSTMRAHPDFAEVILPRVNELRALCAAEGPDGALKALTAAPSELPRLLELSGE